uniref:Uncharacterized protein n=1 Tax=Sphaeramia orbicularis TaxID=375764 RepID=A0A673ABP1_9TELE
GPEWTLWRARFGPRATCLTPILRGTMAKYKLEVTTGNMKNGGTWDRIYITLTGSKGPSERTELNNFADVKHDRYRFNPQRPKHPPTYMITTKLSLGRLLLLKVEKNPNVILPENMWFCSKIVVTTPEGDVILFPCYRWMSNGEVVELRGGRGPTLLPTATFIYAFLTVIFNQSDIVLWVSSFLSMLFNYVFVFLISIRILEFLLKGMFGSTKKWENIDDIKNIFWRKTSEISEYVTDHWKEDEFYGFQFLNGANPNVIVRCSELPPNFAVTEEMVQPFLEEGTTLQKEMEKGNIFLCDQTIMDGVPTRVIDGKPMQVSSGFCLLYMTPESKLMPIAIQLGQLPSETNPIFLPSDSETDWLLAKMFIRNADFNQLQAIHHLKNSHYLAEVYNISTLRNLPEIHPLYKLLIPHFRHNIPSNINGRNLLLAPTGPLGLVCSSLGPDGLMEIMRRAHPGTTYTTLCLPDNIAARGLESVPNFYYRDDGLKLWDVIHSFVKAMMEYYYPSDEEVCKDSELQAWISEIFTHGFLGNKESGIPENFSTVEELIKFITMVIFNSSGQHATTNHSQFDYLSWLPNGPLLLVQPPPTTKGRSSMKTYTDFVPLGSYPDEQFDELVPKQIIKGFQVELKHLSETIDARNSQLEVPYNYFNPSQIENSINV